MLTTNLARPITMPVVRSVTGPWRAGTDLSAQVAALFASLGSTPKLWLDPSDPATRFQDQAGTTLVTADGQPYGRANDKSGGGNHVGQATTTSRPLWKTDGVLSWAQADGVDDSWYSLANLDLSATDRLTLVAGGRKRSDAAIAVLAELGPNANTSNGTFYILAPASAGIATVSILARGSLSNANTALAGIAAGTAFVLVASLNLSAPMQTLTVNGASSSTSAATGGGNFASALLNIFRRNNASLPAALDLFQLLLVGGDLQSSDISLLTRFAAQKSGVTL